MEIAIILVVLFIVGLVMFMVMRGSGRGVRTLLGADALAAKFGTTATAEAASHPAA